MQYQKFFSFLSRIKMTCIISKRQLDTLVLPNFGFDMLNFFIQMKVKALMMISH